MFLYNILYGGYCMDSENTDKKEYDRRINDLFPNIKYKKLTKEELKESIEKSKKGDEDAYFKILCHMHQYLCHLTRNFFILGSDPFDVYQEGAIKLSNVIEKFNLKKGSFVTFAQSSIRKHIITTFNREKAKKRTILNTSYSLDDIITNEEGEFVSFIDTIADESSPINTAMGNPKDIIEKDNERHIIEEVSKSLSEMETEVFKLRFILGYSYKEIAKELKFYKKSKSNRKVLDQKAVDNAIWRSRPKIKKALEKLQICPKIIKCKNELKNMEKKKRKTRIIKKVVKKPTKRILKKPNKIVKKTIIRKKILPKVIFKKREKQNV